MDAIYYFLVDVGSVLAPAVLGGCWYAAAMGLVLGEIEARTATPD